MNGATIATIVPVLSALVVAMGALYKQRIEARKLPSSVASSETRDALEAMGRFNDVLEKRNQALEARVDLLEKRISGLQSRIWELEAELEGYRRVTG